MTGAGASATGYPSSKPPTVPPAPPLPLAPLADCAVPLAGRYDVALLDLDGVVYRGAHAVPSAPGAIEAAALRGMRSVFVTNNALRTPEAVAERLTGFGVPADPDQVVTSAQVAARVLAERLPPGARVLLAGGEGLRRAVELAGLVPVASADETPAAVAQGHDPQMTYARLAEATVAVRAGALWVASNTDATVPTERGLLPGCGAAVAFLRTATGAEPMVTGKPELAMHAESVRRSGARRPLIVGDRLDTDIEAGYRSMTPTLLVLSGVTTASGLLVAPARHRPTFLAADVGGLLRPQRGVRVDGTTAVCGAWACEVRAGTLHWHGADDISGASGAPSAPGARGPGGPGAPDDGLDAVRAACACAWMAADAGLAVRRLADERPPGCAGLDLPSMI